MSVNNQQVAHAWAHGQSAKGSNFHTDGTTLTSYSTPIATKIGDIIYISNRHYSTTTSKQQHYARQAVNHERDNIFYTPAFDRWNTPRFTHEAMIQPAAEQAVRELERALNDTKTRKATKERAVQEYIQDRTRIMTHAARVGVTVTMPEMSATPEAIAEYQERKRQAEELKAAARIIAVRKQQRLDKKQLTVWLTTGAGSYPTSFRVRGADQFTLKDGKIVTSQGAECPLDHAIKALKFYESRHTGNGFNTPEFVPYHTNGHKIPLGIFTLDSIDEQGNVKAGCHTFTAAEIQRFIKQWRGVLGL